jgi:hypothetical protein
MFKYFCLTIYFLLNSFLCQQISFPHPSFDNKNNNTQNNAQTVNVTINNNIKDLLNFVNGNDVNNKNFQNFITGNEMINNNTDSQFVSFFLNTSNIAVQPNLAISYISPDFDKYELCYWKCGAKYGQCWQNNNGAICKDKLWKCYQCIKKDLLSCKLNCDF